VDWSDDTGVLVVLMEQTLVLIEWEFSLVKAFWIDSTSASSRRTWGFRWAPSIGPLVSHCSRQPELLLFVDMGFQPAAIGMLFHNDCKMLTPNLVALSLALVARRQ